VTVFSSATLEVELTAGVWTDITGWYDGPVTIRQGRATLFEEIGAAVLKVKLNNADGRFMPENTGSPYSPNWAKNKRIRWKVTKAAVTYTRFVGWIQSIQPVFPSGSISDAYVAVTAVDALGLMAQRKMRSYWSEFWLQRTRLGSGHCDVWEPVGETSGFFPWLTNLSPDSTRAGQSATSSDVPTLKFGDDPEVAIGQIVTADVDSSGEVNRIIPGMQASPQSCAFVFKSPSTIGTAGVKYSIATFFSSGPTAYVHVVVQKSGANNALYLTDSANTTILATMMDPIPTGQWMLVSIYWVAGNTFAIATYNIRTNTVNQVSAASVDLTNVVSVSFPGQPSPRLSTAFGGMASSSRSPFTSPSLSANPSYVAKYISGWTGSGRITSLMDCVDQLPISYTIVGSDDSHNIQTGTWSDRYALDVGREIMRSVRGILWARGRDSQVLAVKQDALRPTTPVVTIGCETEMLGALKTTSAVDANPTRIIVNTASTTAIAVDVVAEANGESRSISISSVNGNVFEAAAVAQSYLQRSAGLRIEQVAVDLSGPVTDPTATLFDESTALGGLYPTQRIQLTGLPATHFPLTTYDAFVEGWTETYDGSEASLLLDTSRALGAQLAAETWTGTNGAAWPVAWVAGSTSGAGTAATIQGNQGRLNAGTTANTGYISQRLSSPTVADLDFTITLTLAQTAGGQPSAAVWWRSDSGVFNNGYHMHLDTSAIQNIRKTVGGTVFALTSVLFTPVTGTAYKMRIRMVGAVIQAKVWAAAGSEPAAWGATYADSSFTAAGYIGLSMQNDATTSKTVDFDDFTLREGAL
jgi:hypothetical protein